MKQPFFNILFGALYVCTYSCKSSLIVQQPERSKPWQSSQHQHAEPEITKPKSKASTIPLDQCGQRVYPLSDNIKSTPDLISTNAESIKLPRQEEERCDEAMNAKTLDQE